MQQTDHGEEGFFNALFRHNAWANLLLLEFCEGLSDRQLDATAVGCFGSIHDTLVHIVSAEADYVNLATGKPPPAADRFVGFAALKDAVRESRDELLGLAEAARAGVIVRVRRPGEPSIEYPLAGLLVQVLHHATEHRAQVSTIVTQLGLEPPSLSGWAYLRRTGEFREFTAPAGGAE